MKNTFGTSVCLTLFGESHGEAVGCVIDGLAPGIPADDEAIARALRRRRPGTALDTQRREPDEFRIVSGVFNGVTTGTPICILIPNTDARSQDYTQGMARPSHADYTAHMKYHGYQDYRGGGHFSGRVTAALVAAGAIFKAALSGMDVELGSHICCLGGEYDREFADLKADLALLREQDIAVLDPESRARMDAAVEKAKARGDSLGGITCTAVTGLPAGVGEPWFDSMEGVLSHALFSVGGIKGVSFGAGFDCAGMTGSQYNDSLRSHDRRVVTETNHDGGINGGITNGMPVLFSCAVKPTPSISLPQRSVELSTMEDTDLTVRGRHDPAIIRRICPVIDAVTAAVLCDMLALRYGTDVFTKGING